MNNISYFLVVHLLFSLCLCEISNGQKEKLLNDFKEYYNSLPSQVYRSEEGSLLSTQQVDDSTYQIVASIRVAEINNVEATKLLKCTATIKDSDSEVTIMNNNCEEAVEQKQSTDENQETTLEPLIEVSEPTVERKPVQLVNEVQADTDITSGEQFIAIPLYQPNAPCVGCVSHINPQAAGVSDLTNLGVRHLDLHESSIKHSLESVIDVERQVQVVNGVRYVITLSINSNHCTEVESENCASSKTCKITILEKSWVKLPNGGNYRAILANNCTEEWQYGDDGEVLPELSAGNNQIKGNTSVDPSDITFDGDIQVKHNTNAESQHNQERSLTEENIKNIQEQIISNTQFQEITESSRQSTLSSDASDASKQHVFKVEAGNQKMGNSIPVTESDFFNFSGFKLKSEAEDVPRVRRSYDYDLQVLSLAKDFHGIKNNLENVRFVYEMAQVMVDYLNDMDLEVKNRVIKNIMRAGEETENLQRFVYIQARVTIPCDKVECEQREVNTQICNGVIDCSNEKSPQILNTFCYNDNKESEYREGIREISLDDPVLRRMAEEAVNKIESDSESQYAMKINKIASAITQVTSGTLTKFSIIVENIKCNKSVPLPLRINCTVLEQLGSKICDVIVHERHWLKEKKISYTCTERPADMRISKSKIVSKNVTVDDPAIIGMLQEAIQYLESQSDKSNKQKIVNVKSISSQIIAGFLTKIEFVVGYTDCTDENYSRDQINKCELLKGEGFRSCRAQIWDRSWIMDGRQIEVSCDDASKTNEIDNTRKKRSIDSASDQEQQSSSKNNDIDYKKLATESLYKFMQSSFSHQHYEVVKVDKAVVQDVSRKLIKMDFSISPTDCLIQNDGILSSPKCVIVNPKNMLHCHSKILQNNLINKKQYFVKCNIKYQQKKITKMLKERNLSDSKYYQLAEESLAKYLHDTGNPHHRIVRAKAFNVSCNMKKKEHLVKINTENPKYMQIAVESLQKYIQDNPESHLVRVAFVDKVEQKGDTVTIEFIASHTEEGDGDTFCYAEVSETRESKSDIEVKCHLIGIKIYRKDEITEDDPNYYKYVQLADESLRNYLQKINSSLYTLVSIESVTVQWDEGIKTLINFTISPIDTEHSELKQGKQCIAEILEHPELHKKNTDVKCELEKELYRTKRQASKTKVRRQFILGGVKEHDPSNPEYQGLAEESLRKYVVDSGITQPLQVARIEKVTSQVVSGTLTRIDFLVSGSPDSETIKCHSEVWDRPWLNRKEINVSCQNDRHLRGKRHLVGGPKDQDPTEPRYKALAEESLRKYKIDYGIAEPLEVVQVERVTTQTVAGLLTRIDFLVSGSPNSKVIKCHSKIVDRPWLKSKKINVSCQNDSHLRGKRQDLPGGISEVDPTAPEYKVLAEESLRKYTIDYGIAEPLEVVQVERVTTQIVAGLLTRIDFLVSGSPNSKIIKCHSKIVDRPWLNSKKIDVSCQNDSHLRGKRQDLPGGISEVDPTAPQYKALAEESLRKYKIDYGIAEPLEVVQVERVTTQTVAGLLTRIDFLVSGRPNSKVIKCHSKIVDRPWLNSKKINVSCQNDSHLRGKRQDLPGGISEVDPTAPEYKVLAEESLRKYTIDYGIAEPLEVVQVERVTTQIVAGLLTRIDFLVSGSPNSKIIKCHSKIVDRPWLNSKKIDVSCQNDSHLRGKRQDLPGGISEENPTAPQYKALAEESLRKYMIDFEIAQPLEVVQVERVTTQTVAGLLTRIDFLVSGSPNSKIIKCHSKIVDRPWLNSKEINVSCQNDSHLGGERQVLPGGISEVDPTAPEYKVLAEESLRKYTIDYGIAEPLEVVQVERVTTQTVAGLLTRIDFLVSGSPNSKIIKCHSKIVDRPWLNSKKIDVSCQNDSHLRGKRQDLPGGISEVDPTAPQYKALAEESLRKYKIDYGIAEPLEVVQVERVTTQTVAGLLTRIDFLVSGRPNSKIIKCHSEVLEQSWLNFKEIKVSCENLGHRGMLGGIFEDDPTAPQYKALAEESLRKYMIDFAIAQPFEVVQVERVTTQTVAGLLTRIDFLVSGSPNAKIIKCHSEVWEKRWLNFKEIKVSCENLGHRGMLGGISEVDPTAPQYKVLAEESLRKYTIDYGIAEPLEVVQVERVTTQTVAGLLTRIDFLVSGSPNSKIIKCHSKIVDRPWLNSKEIDVSCQNDSHLVGKRQVLPGGISEEDPTAPEYKVLAEESLRKYTIDYGIAEPLEVVQVERVTTQTVAGLLTRIDFLVSGSPNSKIIKCHSKIVDRPWLNSKKIDVSCQNDSHLRGKRQDLPGGISEVDPTAPQYKALAEESLRKYKIDYGIAEPLEVVQVERVTTQTVAGLLTRIDFLVSGSPNSKIIKCHSKIVDRPWLNSKEINVSCQNDSHLGGERQVLPGGISEVDPTAPEYKVLAEESLRKYTIDYGIAEPLEVVQVERVTTQTVAGLLTRIDFLVSGSPNSKIIKCHSKIVDRPWLNSKKIDVSCQNDSHLRGKRQDLPGGISEVDPTAPQYKALAEESLRKYKIDYGIAEPLEVVQVERVTTQTVAGLLTRIDFLVSGRPNSKIIKCHSEVLEQSWLNFKEIKVSCENLGHRGMLGGIFEDDPTAPQYKALAEESLRKYMIDFAIAQPFEVVQVERVTTQTVAGLLTRIDFLVSGSPNSKIIKCHSKIVDRPWLNSKKIDVSCQNDSHLRGKRQDLPGGISEVDPTVPQYKALAEESLRKYMIDFAIAQPFEVVQVERVTTQTVAGLLTRIDFLVSGSPNAKIIKCHSEVWEKRWLNFKEIKVSCENLGHRGMLGGISEVDPTAPQYKVLAEESLRKYTIDYGIAEPLEVVQVERVTTQTVAGLLTRIDFLVSGSPKSKIIKCHSKIVDRPWLNSKDIDVSCQNDSHLVGKRQVLPGGISEEDPTAPEYKVLAEESFRKYTIDYGIAEPLEVVQVERVTTQTVAGLLTRIDFLVSGSPNSKIIKCHSKIVDRPWLNSKKIDVSCQNDSHLRGKRQDLPGGISEVDPTAPQYKALAEESLRKYKIDYGIAEPLEVVQVERVTTQTVAGLLTRIDFLVSGRPNSKIIKCHSEVLEQSWLNFKEIKVSCENLGHRGMLGGIFEDDPTAPQYKALAEESLRKYMIDFAIAQPFEVVQVERVTTQNVAGLLTRIDFLVSGSPNSKIIKCHSKIVDLPWLNSKEIDVSCQNDSHLGGKRQVLPGGISEEDPTAPEYKLLAEESLRKYRIDYGIAEPLEVVQVERVTTQTVAGLLTRIDFLVSGSPNSKIIKCHSKIVDRPWLNSKEIDVSCQNDSHLGGKRQVLPGGISEVDPTAPEYKVLAEESLRKYTIDYGIAEPLEVVQVERVTTQTVAGLLTRIDFLVSGRPNSKIIKCHSEVLEQSWLNFKEIKVSCENLGHRGMLGGIFEDDPTAPQYKALAEESLRKYMIAFAIAQPLEVVQVERVTTQTVAGLLTRIDFLVSGSPNSKIIKCHSKIVDRPWLNSKEIDVSCQNDSHLGGKRQVLPGGISEVDPTAPEYKVLAEESLRKYTIDYGIAEPLEVVQVERVTTQTVAGLLTRIDFLVSGSPNSKIIKCHSKIVDRPWLNSKKIDVSCQNDSHLRGKRQDLPGGISEVDPTAPQYKALAEESLRKYKIDYGIAEPLEVVQVERVTTQTVAGLLTRIDFLVSGRPNSKIIKCHSEVLEQSWLNFKEIKVSCENLGHRGMLGGIFEDDPTAPQYKALAEESLRKYMIDFAIAQPFEVVQVERVTTQNVAGLLTRIDFLVSGSPNSKIIKCHSKIVDLPWLNSKEIDVSCQNDSHLGGKRQVLPGGISEEDPTAPEYKLLAEESLRKYRIDYGIAEPLEVVQVERVTTQTVAGLLTRIDFLVSGSPNSKIIKCHSKIVDRPWLNSKEIDVSCQNDSHLGGKRQVLPGGISEVDPTAPEYKVLAEESLRKYTIDYGIAEPLEVVQVERVTTQTVAGLLTRIDFLVSGRPNSKIIKCHSEVLEQSWLNFKEIKVSCENLGHRGMLGGIFEDDPTAPQYKALAEESLRKYMIAFAIAQPLEVVQVERVTTQTVAGLLTRIDFLVSGSPNSKIIKCHSKIVDRPWLNSKEIDVSCQNDSHLGGKRQVLPGGISEVDPTAPEYKVLAEESLRKYTIDYGIAEPLEVVQVERVTTQTVAGLLTRIDFLVSGSPNSKIIKCHSKIVDRPWLNSKEINVSCQNDSHLGGKRQVLPGGISEVDPTAPEYKVLAEESLRKYRIDYGIAEPLEVVQVERVTTQTVAGLLTRIDFLVSGSPNSKIIKCHSKIVDRPWLNSKEIDVFCQNDSHLGGKRQVLPGGISEEDPTAPEYKVLAEESLRKYRIDYGIAEPLELVQVERVTTQTVAGLLTRIDFLVSGSPNSKIIKCHSKIVDRPWLNSKEIDVSCQNDSHLGGKRQVLPGGISEVDPTAPEYKVLAEESLRKYTIDYGIAEPLEVVQVERVTTQTVAGLLTRIDFLVSGRPNSKIIKCHSEVLEQSWLNFKEIKFSCENLGHRGMLGGIFEDDPTAPQYKALAEESLRKYMIDFAIAQPLEVVQVERVTTQTVAGLLTRIDFLVSGSPNSKIIKCHSKIVDRPWLNSKEIDVSCQNDSHLGGKRQVLPGGISEEDPTAPEYKVLAEESLRKYRIDYGIAEPLELVQVERVTTQTVAGLLTHIDFLVSGSPNSKIIKCHSKIVDRPWLNSKEIDVSCQNDSHLGGKRQVLPGGISEVDPTAPEYKVLAEESLRKYTIDYGIAEPLEVVQVERVITQTVAGLLTRIDFLVSGRPNSKIIKCHSKILDRPWLYSKKIDVSCQNDSHLRGKRQDLPGGISEVDPTAPQYKALAEESLRKYKIDNGIAEPLEVVQVERVTMQLVAGLMTRIDFLVTGSPNAKIIKCHSEVWEQGWRNFKEIKVSCEIDDHRLKKQDSPGGISEVGPTALQYKALAEEFK